MPMKKQRVASKGRRKGAKKQRSYDKDERVPKAFEKDETREPVY